MVLNTWEAVYFDHDLARLTALAERAAEVGVERFVLDGEEFGSLGDVADRVRAKRTQSSVQQAPTTPKPV